MSVGERLLEEFEAAINAVLGDGADLDYEDVEVEKSDILAIANKVIFYLDL